MFPPGNLSPLQPPQTVKNFHLQLVNFHSYSAHHPNNHPSPNILSPAPPSPTTVTILSLSVISNHHPIPSSSIIPHLPPPSSPTFLLHRHPHPPTGSTHPPNPKGHSLIYNGSHSLSKFSTRRSTLAGIISRPQIWKPSTVPGGNSTVSVTRLVSLPTRPLHMAICTYLEDVDTSLT